MLVWFNPQHIIGKICFKPCRAALPRTVNQDTLDVKCVWDWRVSLHLPLLLLHLSVYHFMVSAAAGEMNPLPVRFYQRS